MIKKLITSLILIISGTTNTVAQKQILTIDSCLHLALQHGKEIAIARQEVMTAEYEKKVAFANYLPKLSATGTYLHNQKRISLLNKQQQDFLQSLGTKLQNNAAPLLQNLTSIFPELNEIVSQTDIAEPLNSLGASIADAFSPDTRNIYAATLSLEQPIYAGGKITAYNKIADIAGKIADNNIETTIQNTTLAVYETYWQTVSLSNKEQLAKEFLNLTNKLYNDVEKIKAVGMATNAELLSVKVKVDEARLTLMQIGNALSLSRMLLNKICGLPIDNNTVLYDEHKDSINNVIYIQPIDNYTINRSEIRNLRLAADIYDEKAKVIQADYRPQLVITANYIASYPDFSNGFEKKTGGIWNAGVILRIPLWNWGEGYNKVKAAKAKANIARYTLDDISESVELQVQQAHRQLNTAQQQSLLANSNIKSAEENLNAANKAFAEGMSTSDNVLEAQTAWLKAHTEKIDAAIEVILSHIRLRRALGKL